MWSRFLIFASANARAHKENGITPAEIFCKECRISEFLGSSKASVYNTEYLVAADKAT